MQLTEEEVAHLLNASEAGANATFTVDLDTQLVTDPNGGSFKFEVDAFQKHCLFNGLDDIGLTLEKVADIDKFEGKRGARAPWL